MIWRIYFISFSTYDTKKIGCNVSTKLSSFVCSEFFYEQKKLVKFLIASVQLYNINNNTIVFILDGFTCHRSDQENTYKKESHDIVEWVKNGNNAK